MAIDEVATTGRAAAERAIRARMEEWIAAWNRHDTAALLAFKDPGCTLMDSWGRRLEGLEQIDFGTQAMFQSVWSRASATVKVRAVDFESDGVALLDAGFEIRGSLGLDNQEQPPRKEHIFAVLVEREGVWYLRAARFYRFDRSK